MIFFAVIMALILPAVLWLMLECGVSRAAAVSIIGITYLLLIVSIIAFERKKRLDISRRIERLLENGTAEFSSDDGLTAAENRFILNAKNFAVREERLKRGYSEISSLIADISHQCKTPLSSIMMFAELLGDGEYERQIKTQAEKLKFLMDSLGKCAKCEGGLIGGNLSPAKNSVTELICRCVGDIFPSAERKGIKIVSSVDEELLAVFDMSWTAEAVFNLLDNAVKYSHDGSEIVISAEKHEMFVKLSVKDSGIGIPEEEICNIWKRFFRGSGDVRERSGVGIGLYLTKLIVNSEGGRVSVSSVSGEGSVFCVYLPAAESQ